MSNFILTYRDSKGIIKHKFYSNSNTGEQMLDYALKYLHPKDDNVLCVETWVTRDIYNTDPTIKQTMHKEYIMQFENQ